MISFEKVDKSTFANPGGLSVSDEQAVFVCKDVTEYVRTWRDDLLHNCYLILDGANHVGFFALDLAEDRHRAYVGLDADFCVLRCFFIDERHQGKGFAGAALAQLPALARAAFPGVQKIYLTVNERNPVAYKLYEKAGYKTLEQRYLGGGAGPQRVMVQQL
ncbi:MAG: GNAT family N-acetyltransferase [Bdellovibrionales bacterium]